MVFVGQYQVGIDQCIGQFGQFCYQFDVWVEMCVEECFCGEIQVVGGVDVWYLVEVFVKGCCDYFGEVCQGGIQLCYLFGVGVFLWIEYC